MQMLVLWMVHTKLLFSFFCTLCGFVFVVIDDGGMTREISAVLYYLFYTSCSASVVTRAHFHTSSSAFHPLRDPLCIFAIKQSFILLQANVGDDARRLVGSRGVVRLFELHDVIPGDLCKGNKCAANDLHVSNSRRSCPLSWQTTSHALYSKIKCTARRNGTYKRFSLNCIHRFI
jgi:hypothetical protein